MALATYADLKSAIADWTHRSDLTTRLDDFVTLAESWIYREVRAREMESDLSITTVTGSQGPIPSDWIGPKTVTYTSGGQPRNLTHLTPKQLRDKYGLNNGAEPYFFAIDGSNMIFDGVGSGVTITGKYYKNLGALSAGVHAVFTAYPDLYLFAGLTEAYLFMKDKESAALWSARRDNMKDNINGYNVKSRSSDGMAVTPG